MGEMWIRMNLRRWDNTELILSLPIEAKMVDPGNGCVGYLEVFDSLMSAEKTYPDSHFICIQEKEASDEQK